MPLAEVRVGACASITHFLPLTNDRQGKPGETTLTCPLVPKMRAVILPAVALVTEQSRLAALSRPGEPDGPRPALLRGRLPDRPAQSPQPRRHRAPDRSHAGHDRPRRPGLRSVLPGAAR